MSVIHCGKSYLKHCQLDCVSMLLLSITLSADLLAEYFIGGNGRKEVPWLRLLDRMFQHKVRLIGWVSDVPPPGPNFRYKTIKTDQLKALRDSVQFESWTAGRSPSNVTTLTTMANINTRGARVSCRWA